MPEIAIQYPPDIAEGSFREHARLRLAPLLTFLHEEVGKRGWIPVVPLDSAMVRVSKSTDNTSDIVLLTKDFEEIHGGNRWIGTIMAFTSMDGSRFVGFTSTRILTSVSRVAVRTYTSFSAEQLYKYENGVLTPQEINFTWLEANGNIPEGIGCQIKKTDTKHEFAATISRRVHHRPIRSDDELLTYDVFGYNPAAEKPIPTGFPAKARLMSFDFSRVGMMMSRLGPSGDTSNAFDPTEFHEEIVKMFEPME